MNKPSPGDTVECKINDDFIVYRYVDRFDSISLFDIICSIATGYIVKVPVSIFLSNSFEATISKAREYCIPDKFIGINAHFITDEHIVSIRLRKDGECCDRCKDFFPYAARDSNGNFKCFSCRVYRFR